MATEPDADDATETNHNLNESADKPWQDADLVNYLYHEEEMSGPEIADELGCSVSPIYDRIDDTRSFGEANKIWQLKRPASFTTDEDGYERVGTKIDGKTFSTALHRLVAVAEWGTEAVEGNIVHHRNGVPWDNRADNLELMEQSDHVREHFEEIPKHEKAAIWSLGKVEGETAESVGERFGLSRSTVTSIWSRIDSGDYPITEVKA